MKRRVDPHLFKIIPLIRSQRGIITLSHLSEPYGSGTPSVLNIGVSLSGDDRWADWKIHIPYEQIDELIAALKEAKERFM